jgi:hypothetical protein
MAKLRGDQKAVKKRLGANSEFQTALMRVGYLAGMMAWNFIMMNK